MIRPESLLKRPIWLLGYGRDYIAVDAVLGNASKNPPAIWQWQLLEILEYHSFDTYIRVLIGSEKDYDHNMIKQLESLGVKHVRVIGEEIKNVAVAYIPCNYIKLIEVAGLSFVRKIESLISLKVTRVDVNGDGIVDIRDITVAARAFGSYPAHPEWNEKADINFDFTLDIRDIVLIAGSFGQIHPMP